jgi:protoporphyrinogen IX oxidase
MLWLKAFHIVFMVMWFAGLFYLPRLFVYHALTSDFEGLERFKVMERKLYRGIMMPAAILTILSGLSLLFWYWPTAIQTSWMQAKLALVTLLVGYHLWCGRLAHSFAQNRNQHGHRWYRWFNEAPVILLLAIVLLIVLNPS